VRGVNKHFLRHFVLSRPESNSGPEPGPAVVLAVSGQLVWARLRGADRRDVPGGQTSPYLKSLTCSIAVLHKGGFRRPLELARSVGTTRANALALRPFSASGTTGPLGNRPAPPAGKLCRGQLDSVADRVAQA
jgi:hypothetical protein